MTSIVNNTPAGTSRSPRTAAVRRLAATGLAIGLFASCGDDGSTSLPDVISVEMADFEYRGLPSEMPAGTRIEVTNSSPGEIHEFVAFNLGGDDRPIEEIVGGDLPGLLGGSEPSAVLLAAPGGPQIPAVGDGTLTEPGRYLIVCVIPTGADPDEYLAAAATSDGPPQVDGGPPHVAEGMFAELEVTG